MVKCRFELGYYDSRAFKYCFHYMLRIFCLHVESRNAQGHLPLLSGFLVYVNSPKYWLVEISIVPCKTFQDYHK